MYLVFGFRPKENRRYTVSEAAADVNDGSGLIIVNFEQSKQKWSGCRWYPLWWRRFGLSAAGVWAAEGNVPAPRRWRSILRRVRQVAARWTRSRWGSQMQIWGWWEVEPQVRLWKKTSVCILHDILWVPASCLYCWKKADLRKPILFFSRCCDHHFTDLLHTCFNP